MIAMGHLPTFTILLYILQYFQSIEGGPHIYTYKAKLIQDTIMHYGRVNTQCANRATDKIF